MHVIGRMTVRIGIVGTGWVGASVAISTLQAGVASELLLSDARMEVAEGEAMDLAHGASFYPTARVRACEVEAMRDCDAVVIAAGRGGSPTESRLDLLRDNAAIATKLGRQLASGRGILVVVTNPVDVMTRIVAEASGLPAERVIGTGTLLDTARLRRAVGRELSVDPRSVHAYVLGEHGDSEVCAWSRAHAGGAPLRHWQGWSAETEARLATEVRRAAYEIIARKGATNHAIGLATASLLRALVRDERRVLTVSRVQANGAAYSLPAIVGSSGALEVLPPPLDASEREGLERSVAVLQQAYAEARA